MTCYAGAGRSCRPTRMVRASHGTDRQRGSAHHPPRDRGTFDIKQLTAGTMLLLPVYTPGALFSSGDAHFAQGDGESCGTAVEMGAT